MKNKESFMDLALTRYVAKINCRNWWHDKKGNVCVDLSDDYFKDIPFLRQPVNCGWASSFI